jgi:hypothetical protein
MILEEAFLKMEDGFFGTVIIDKENDLLRCGN